MSKLLLQSASRAHSDGPAAPRTEWAEICRRILDAPARALEIFAAAGLNAETLRPHCSAPSPGEPYGRKVLHQSPECEVMLAIWEVGAECHPHDHGFSDGLVWLVAGDFVENDFVIDDANGLCLLRSVEAREGSAKIESIESRSAVAERARGSIVDVDHTKIHSMRTPTGGISLHIYSPPIHAMKVFDPMGRRTLTVSDDCGAWIPTDPSLIRDITPWPPRSFPTE